MALNITNAYATIFQPEDKGKFVKADISSSRKVKDQNGNETYANSSWKANFVGKCVDKAKSFEPKDRIKINNAFITHEKSNNVDANGKPIYYTNVTVFDFEFLNKQNVSSSSGEQVEDLPF